MRIVLAEVAKRLRFKSGGNCDFGFEELGNGTAGFGVLHRKVEFCLIGARNPCVDVEMTLCDGKAVADLFDGNRCGGFELFSNHALAAQLGG